MFPDFKSCSRCNIEQSHINFYPDKYKTDKLSSRCKECKRIEGRLWAKTPQGRKTYKRNHKKFRESEKGKKFYKAYSKTEIVKKAIKRYQQSEKGKLSAKRYKTSFKGKCKQIEWNGRRRAQKLRATPKWLTKNHFKIIEMFYQLAAYMTEVTGIKWEVDHIIPLQAKNMSGLHVPWNLRVITRQENLIKKNKVEVNHGR